jgi:hypothetical protein
MKQSIKLERPFSQSDMTRCFYKDQEKHLVIKDAFNTPVTVYFVNGHGYYYFYGEINGEFVFELYLHFLEGATVTDGVLNFNVKVVVVTNLPSSTNFDGGLTRGGRHYKTVTFKELTPWEANEARVAIGLEPLGFLKSVALGSALGSTEGDMKHTTEKRGAGFTS